jgi:MHS family proline/betaine transporter-like MFS transporter
MGRFADLRGRKPALVICIFLMAFGTLLTGGAPNYRQIGALAPVVIVTARMFQGFALGGGAGGAMAFVVEWAPERHRGLCSGLQYSGVCAGLLLGSLIAALCSTFLTDAHFQAWGWRIPFFIGVTILPIGLYVRSSVSETPIFAMAARRRPAVNDTRKENAFLPLWRAFRVIMLWASALYIFLNYMPTFTAGHAHLTRSASLWANSIGLVAVIIAIPFFGYLSDRIGRRPILLAASAAFILLPYPLLHYTVSHASFGPTTSAQIVLGVMVAALCGVCPAAIAEIFPTSSRTMLMSISYGSAVAISGGFAAYVATWLIRETGSPMAPAFYVMANAVVTGLASLGLRETAHVPLK